MKTVAPLTPADAGLSINVCSGPRGSVRDDWPCIEYTLQLICKRKVVWQGEFRLGVGHVKPVKYSSNGSPLFHLRLTAQEENLSHHWAMGQTFKKEPKILQLHADTAAKLAISQKVTPKLEDVCHSLLCDGSAFFDGETFQDWADNLGYSSDSIKAKETFDACDKIGRELTRALSRDDLEGLREWASNY